MFFGAGVELDSLMKANSFKINKVVFVFMAPLKTNGCRETFPMTTRVCVKFCFGQCAEKIIVNRGPSWSSRERRSGSEA